MFVLSLHEITLSFSNYNFFFYVFLYFMLVPIDTRIIRICGWDDSSYKGKCYHRSGFGGRQEVCSCETDNCNGAKATRMPAFIVGVVSICIVVTSFLVGRM